MIEIRRSRFTDEIKMIFENKGVVNSRIISHEGENHFSGNHSSVVYHKLTIEERYNIPVILLQFD